MQYTTTNHWMGVRKNSFKDCLWQSKMKLSQSSTTFQIKLSQSKLFLNWRIFCGCNKWTFFVHFFPVGLKFVKKIFQQKTKYKIDTIYFLIVAIFHFEKFCFGIFDIFHNVIQFYKTYYFKDTEGILIPRLWRVYLFDNILFWVTNTG